MNLEDKIAALIGPDDLYIYGFARLGGKLDDRYAGLGCALSIARRLDPAVVDGIEQGPTLRYLEEYHTANAELARLIGVISTMLTSEGIRNVPVQPTYYNEGKSDPEFPKTLRTPFSHKMAATQAGLGWIGKTDLLVTLKFGPRVRLATILIDHEFQRIGTPITASRCGACTVCVDACPAHAANGKPWDCTMDRSDFYDAFKCRETCLGLSMANLNTVISLCGICVAMCPFGKRATD
jgi:epoxyqueuosine reductase QueG